MYECTCCVCLPLDGVTESQVVEGRCCLVPETQKPQTGCVINTVNFYRKLSLITVSLVITLWHSLFHQIRNTIHGHHWNYTRSNAGL